MMTSVTVFCILAGLGLPTRVVGCERNYPGHKPIHWAWRLLRRIVYRFADANVAQTRQTSLWLRKHTAAQNVSVIPNPISWPMPASSAQVSTTSVVGPEQRFILAVGSKVQQKGFDLLLEAYAQVARDHPECDLVLLGLASAQDDRNSAANQLRAQAAMAGLAERVHLPGQIGNISEWYERAEIFVLSSRYEGFPNVLLEAMAAGCACVAFDCETGPREVIVDGENGVLIPTGNTVELSKSLHWLLDDSVSRQKLGREAQAVTQKYSEDRVFAEWLVVLRAVLNN